MKYCCNDFWKEGALFLVRDEICAHHDVYVDASCMYLYVE